MLYEELQDFQGEGGVRLICRATEDLSTKVQQMEMSMEFYGFISTRIIKLPSLMERREDIPILAEHYCQTLSQVHGKNINGISQASMTVMLNYNWPGNLTELRNIIEQQVLLCQENNLTIPKSALQQGLGVGGYHLKKRLAVGGMGEIWLAQHDLLNRSVAFKIITAGEDSDGETRPGHHGAGF